MAGMTGDRGGVEGKYLLEARSQQQQVGRPAMFLDSTALEQLVADGKTAEIWQANLAQGDGRTGTVLADLQWHPEKLTDIKISREGNQWNVAFIRRLDNTKKAFRFPWCGKPTSLSSSSERMSSMTSTRVVVIG